MRIEARPGREADVESFLEGGLSLVNEEPDTITWYAIRLGPSTFGIFDSFPADSGRVAEALMGNVGELIEEPSIEQVDIIAAKLPQ